MQKVGAIVAKSEPAPYAVEISDGTHTWRGDEPIEVGGGGTAPSPKALLLSGLATCVAITVRMYAARKQWPLQGITVRLQSEAAAPPEVGTAISASVELEGELSDDQRARLLQVADACPVHRLLSGPIRVSTVLAGGGLPTG